FEGANDQARRLEPDAHEADRKSPPRSVVERAPRVARKGPPDRKTFERRTAKDGALMEPSGRKRWQPVANAEGSKRAQKSRNCCRRLRPTGGLWSARLSVFVCRSDQARRPAAAPA